MHRFTLFIFLVFSLFSFIKAEEITELSGRNNSVLVLNSYNETNDWMKSIQQAVAVSLQGDNKLSVALKELSYYELGSLEELEKKKDEILSGQKPKAVVIIGGAGWIIYRSMIAPSWKDVPVLVCLSQSYTISLENLLARNEITDSMLIPLGESGKGYNVTFVIEKMYQKETVEVMCKLMPEIKKIALISDDLYSGLYYRRNLLSTLKESFPQLDYIDLSIEKMPTEAMLDSISRMDNKTGLLFYSWCTHERELGYSRSSNNVQRMIGSYAKVPLFSAYDAGVEEGIFTGGYFVLMSNYLKSVVGALNSVLRSNKTDYKPMILIAPSPEIYLNYNSLNRFNVSPSLYPEDAIYIGKPESFWEKNKYIVILCIVSFVFLILFLIQYIYNQIKTKNSREREISFLQEYKNLFNNMPVLYTRYKVIYESDKKEVADYELLDLNTEFKREFHLSEKVTTHNKKLFPIMESRDLYEVTNLGRRIRKEYYHKPTSQYYDVFVCPTTVQNVVDVFYVNKTDQISASLEVDRLSNMNNNIIRAIPDMIFFYDRSYCIADIYNPNEELLLLDPSLLKGASLDNFQVPEVTDLLKKTIDEAFKTGVLREIEYSLIIREREYFFDARLLKISDELVIGFIRDVSERNEERTALKKMQRLLEQVNHKLEMALDAASVIPAKYHVPTGTIYIGDKVFPKGVLMPLVYPEELEQHLDMLSKLSTGELTKVKCELRLNLNNKGYEWYDFRAVTDEYDENGNPLSILGSCINITHQREMEQQLRDAKENAEESNRMKSAFLANMSHEIRTPLNAIVGFSGILAQSDNQEEKNEYLKVIEDNNTLLLQLINDILDLAKIEAGTLEFVFTEVNINEMLDGIEQVFLLKMQETELEIVFDERMEECFIRTERNRLTQIITNFISNAIKFTEQGSIKFGYRQCGDELYFYVKDTGCGISKENQKGIFDRFTKLNSFMPGTGLGLSISKTIITKLGGRIGVDSEEGKGSTFWFTLPCSLDEPHKPLNAQIEEPVVIKEESKAGREKVNKKMPLLLIAEDNPSNFLLFESLLKKGYELIHAWNGKEAVEMFASQKPDLILMDIRMPIMDGYQAVQEIRKSSMSVPIIGVTAHAFADDEERIITSGFNGYLSKPINSKKLKEAIESYLPKV